MVIRISGRHTQIEQLLATEGSVNVDRLAAQFGVTASTIRRDLQRLTQNGRVARTYGGAVSTDNQPHESTLRERARQRPAEKDAIGRWAAAQICAGETVFLDAGTTTGRVAHHLRKREGITVVTNSITAIYELANADNIEVIVLGGRLRHLSQGLTGPLTDLAIGRLSADRLFLGADGLVAGRGICEADATQTRAKELMATRAEYVYVLADSSKIGNRAFNAWAPLVGSWTLVTDWNATAEQLAPFEADKDIDVIVVAPPATLDDGLAGMSARQTDPMARRPAPEGQRHGTERRSRGGTNRSTSDSKER